MKLFEILLLNNLVPFLMRNKILNKCQYGFRKNSGTEHQLIDVITKFTSMLNDPSVKFIDAIFIDKSNASDSLSHGILLQKLYEIRVRGPFLAL